MSNDILQGHPKGETAMHTWCECVRHRRRLHVLVRGLTVSYGIFRPPSQERCCPSLHHWWCVCIRRIDIIMAPKQATLWCNIKENDGREISSVFCEVQNLFWDIFSSFSFHLLSSFVKAGNCAVRFRIYVTHLFKCVISAGWDNIRIEPHTTPRLLANISFTRSTINWVILAGLHI